MERRMPWYRFIIFFIIFLQTLIFFLLYTCSIKWNAYSTIFKGDCLSKVAAESDKLIDAELQFFPAVASLHSDFKTYWMRIDSLLKKLNATEKELKQLNDGYVILNDRNEKLMESSFSTREQKLRKLQKFVQNQIELLQNPEDCKTAKMLYCDVTNVCGFGCELHRIVNCLMRALRTNRTLVYTSQSWRYTAKGWEYTFLPLSKCEADESIIKLAGDLTESRVITVKSESAENIKSWSIPKELAPTLVKIHSDPLAWWVSQFTAYITRYQPWFAKKMEKQKKELSFHGPIAGIQVRRGDKVDHEAARHEVEEYMLYVEQWYKKLELTNKNVNRIVYLATRDYTVLPELRLKYPQYKFIVNNMATRLPKNAGAEEQSRYSEEGVESVVTDIHFLSKSDFLVCTISSNVCRVSYELYTFKNTDVSRRFQSVDNPFRFRRRYSAVWRAILDHTPTDQSEIALSAGDELRAFLYPFLTFNDGFLRGWNLRTNATGKFPAYKARQELFLHDFPVLRDALKSWT